MRAAFTLLEMLVVMAILAMLSGLVFFAHETSQEDLVARAARELALCFDEARGLALRSGQYHGVVFHIENAGDGRILRNHGDHDGPSAEGRHWYAIIGPDPASASVGSGPPDASGFWYSCVYSHPFLPEFEQAMEAAMVGPRRHLPRGTRFLAIGTGDGSSTSSAAGYPRPWHGWVDSSGEILAWGGYDPAVAGSGFDFEGEDGPIPYSSEHDALLNPPEVWGQISREATARYPADIGTRININVTDVLRLGRRQLGYAVDPGVMKQRADGSWYLDWAAKVFRAGPDTEVYPGRPRALLEGLWGDAMLVFDPQGRCLTIGGRARAAWLQNDANRAAGGRSVPAIAHALGTYGGYHITIAPDVDPEESVGERMVYDGGAAPDYSHVDRPEDYFQTITPFRRVFVPRAGGETIIKDMDHPDCRLRPEDCFKP